MYEGCLWHTSARASPQHIGVGEPLWRTGHAYAGKMEGYQSVCVGGGGIWQRAGAYFQLVGTDRVLFIHCLFG